jgi:hypothetical protein
MTALCETCLVTAAFGWTEVACPDCARAARPAPAGHSLDADCARLIAFGWEDVACVSCRGTVFEAVGLTLAA